MAKDKKDKSKKSKNLSTTAVSDASTPAIIDLPDYYYGASTFFRMPNGDTYFGEFCAHRAGLVWREGLGVYTTHDGQIYEGEWREDRLVETKPVRIKFPNGTEYFGKIAKGKYSGAGVYMLPNGFAVSSNFSENKPTKETVIIDVLDKLWCGNTKANTDCTYLLPENEFYLNIDENQGKGVKKRKPTAKYEKPMLAEDHSIIEEEEEKIIFAKSTKTRSSLNFEDSLWYKRYKNFIDKHAAIKEKVKQRGQSALDDAEAKWWMKYQRFKMRRKVEKKRRNTKKPQVIEIKERPEPRTVVVFYPKKQPEAETSETLLKEENEQEEEEEIVESTTNKNIQILYEKLRSEKEEMEKRIRQKFEQRTNKSTIYNKKLDETKNPDCTCKKRTCECVLPCNQSIK